MAYGIHYTDVSVQTPASYAPLPTNMKGNWQNIILILTLGYKLTSDDHPLRKHNSGKIHQMELNNLTAWS